MNEDTVLECVGNEAIAAVSMLNTMIYCFHHPGPHSNGQDIHQELTMDYRIRHNLKLQSVCACDIYHHHTVACLWCYRML